MTHLPNNYPDDSLNRSHLLEILAGFHSFDDQIRHGSMESLMALRQEAVVPILEDLLKDPNPNLRSDAAKALVNIDPRRAPDLILPLLQDKDDTVRWYMCVLLHNCGDERAVLALTKLLEDDSAGDVRYTAASALGEIGAESALPALRRSARQDAGTDFDGRRVRDAAQEAIKKIQRKTKSDGKV